MSLFARVFLTNAAVLSAATAVLVFTPLTVSSPVAISELLVLTAGLVVMVLVNLVLLRRAFAPLRRLAASMADFDPLRPGPRVQEEPAPEIATVTRAFDAMVSRLESERRDSTRALLSAQEEERRRLARELHDEVGQGLTAVLLELDAVARDAPEPHAREVAGAREQLRGTLEYVRAIAKRQRPDVLDDLGLPAALRVLAKSVPPRSGMRAEARVSGRLPDLTPEAELAAYRVAQEGLTNALRHSRGSVVRLELSGNGRGALLRVVDNGHGFEGVEGSGIRGMRERAVMAGGRLEVRAMDGGTEVRLWVPQA